MKEFQLTLLLLFFELCTLHGHVISKREAKDVDRYAVITNKDTIEILNPKAKKPTLREITFYHIIEKPYPDKKQKSIINDGEKKKPNDDKLILKDHDELPTNDFPRPWTNGHGFQYLEGNNLNDRYDAKSAESSDSQRLVRNDVATSTEVNNDELPLDEPENLINDVTSELQNERNYQENDSKVVKNDNELTEEVRNDNDLTKVKTNNNPIGGNEKSVRSGRPIHIERPVENNVTDTDVIADDGALLGDEELPKDDSTNKNRNAELEKIEDDKTIRFRDFITEDEKPRGSRRKRGIDYSKLHEAPPLPLFKIDRFPDYIKEILPSDDKLDIPSENSAYISRTTEKPAYLSRATKNPAYLSRTTKKPAYISRTTEKPIYLTDRPEVAKKPVYVSRTTTEKPENFMPKISVRIGDSEEHKITKKSARNVDEDIEKEIGEVIQQVAEAQDTNTKVENPSFGMNLIGNSGMVWNNLNGDHYKYNVGPDATNTEDHYAQIPVKPTNKLEDTTEKDPSPIDLSNEIESALDEIGHIFEEIINDAENKENTDSDKTTTENYDIHVNFNKDHDKHESFEENTKKPNDIEKERSKLDDNNEINNDNIKEQSLNGQAKTKTAENDDDEVNNVLMNFLNVIQELAEISKKNESENQENVVKDNVIEPHKDSIKDNSESKPNDEKEENSDKSDAVKDLLNNKNYWEWLKETSESHMNIILKRVLGLIKEEVAKQIQHLVFRMMEELGITPPNENDNQQQDKHDSEGKEQTLNDKYWDWLKDSSEAYFNILLKRILGEIKKGVAEQIDILSTRMFKENGYTPPKKEQNNKEEDVEKNNDEDSKVIQTLKSNVKWEWLTKSSDAYLNKIMKRVNQLVEEEVTRQVTHLVKYHMPSQNDEETDENPNKKEENASNIEKNDSNLDENDDISSKSDGNSSRKAKQPLDEKKDEVSIKKHKNKRKHKHEHGHKHKHEDGHKHDHDHEDEHKHEDGHKHNHDHEDEHKREDHERENKDENNDKHIKILATNTYGTSINNEKVTNIFIFALNGTDLKKLKPISNGNGIFVFGTDKEQNQDLDKQTTEIKEPNEITDNSNTDSETKEDKVEITTATPIKDEEVIESTDSDSNKEKNDKDHSKVTEKEKSEEKSETSETPEDNSETQEEDSETPEENSETPEESSEKSESNPDKSGENETEDSEKSEQDSENTDIDSKDNQNTNKDVKDEENVKIDERKDEVDDPIDEEIKDSSENLKDKESNDTTTEISSDKSSK